MQQHNGNSKFCRISQVRRHQQERCKDMMDEQLIPILHFRLEEDSNGRVNVVAGLQRVEFDNTRRNYAFWVRQMITVWIPKPVMLSLDSPQTDCYEDNIAEQFPPRSQKLFPFVFKGNGSL